MRVLAIAHHPIPQGWWKPHSEDKLLILKWIHFRNTHSIYHLLWTWISFSIYVVDIWRQMIRFSFYYTLLKVHVYITNTQLDRWSEFFFIIRFCKVTFISQTHLQLNLTLMWALHINMRRIKKPLQFTTQGLHYFDLIYFYSWKSIFCITCRRTLQ